MRRFFSPRQLAHAPARELHNGAFTTYAEVPARAEAILSAIGRAEEPADHGLAGIAAVHSGRLPRLSAGRAATVAGGVPAGRCDPLCLPGGRAAAAPARAGGRADGALLFRRDDADHAYDLGRGILERADRTRRDARGAGGRADRRSRYADRRDTMPEQIIAAVTAI
jgi:hypothetical protein